MSKKRKDIKIGDKVHLSVIGYVEVLSVKTAKETTIIVVKLPSGKVTSLIGKSEGWILT